MNADKLKRLQIRDQDKQRRSAPAWTLFAGVALLIAAAGYLAWPRAGEQRLFAAGGSDVAPSPPADAPRNEAPRNSGPSPVLTVSGYIVNRERIELSPRFLGVVKWIGVKKGDAVTNGQVVALLDDAEQLARVKEAEGRLASARAAFTNSILDYDRISKLIADKVESKQNEDNLRLRVQAARAAVMEAEGQLELANTYLAWTVIRSPIDGLVLEKLADAGELVTPQSFGGLRGPSTALIAVADPNDLQVEIELNEADIAKVSLDQECRVSPEAYPERSYSGHVTEMAPEANRQKGTLQIKVQIENPDRFLTPELSAKAEFLPRTSPAVPHPLPDN